MHRFVIAAPAASWRSRPSSPSPAGSLDTQTTVQSDVTKLVPSNMPALRDLNTLERVTGVSGEIDVHGPRARRDQGSDVVHWMTDYEQRLLTHYGYLETKGCARATLCPALSLPDLFSGATAGGRHRDSADRRPRSTACWGRSRRISSRR